MQSGMLTLDDRITTWDAFFRHLNRRLAQFGAADAPPMLSDEMRLAIQRELYFYLASTTLRESMRPELVKWARLLRNATNFGIENFDNKEKNGLYSNLLLRNGIEPENLKRLINDLEGLLPKRNGRKVERFRWQLMHRLDAMAAPLLDVEEHRIEFIREVFEALPEKLRDLPIDNAEVAEKISLGREKWDWWLEGVSAWSVREEANRLMSMDGFPMYGDATPAFHFLPADEVGKEPPASGP